MSARTGGAETILVEFSLEEAACLNNALRREMQKAERETRNTKMIGVDEYLRRLDGCLEAVTKAFQKAVHS